MKAVSNCATMQTRCYRSVLHTKIRFPRRARGMTLVEVIVGIVIFAFTALSLTSLAIYARRSSQNNAIYISAHALASSYMEQILASEFSGVLSAATTGSPIPVVTSEGTQISLIPGTNSGNSTITLSTRIKQRNTTKNVAVTLRLVATPVLNNEAVQLRLDFSWSDPSRAQAVSQSTISAIKANT